MLGHFVSILFVVSLTACSGSTKSADKVNSSKSNPCAANPCAANPCAANPCAANPCAANPCAANPCGGGGSGSDLAATGVDFSDWQNWTKVSSAAFQSKGHKSAKWVEVYVPADQANGYTSLSAPFAKGTAVVKTHLADDGGKPGSVMALTVMAKMGPGYDSENGDWYYAMLSADGDSAKAQGKMQACIGCHDSADKDVLFGLPK